MVSGSGKKKEMAFAKDKKQGILAVFAVFLLIGSGIYLKSSMPSNDSNATAITPQQETTVDQTPTDPNNTIQPNQQDLAQDANNIYSQTMNMQGNNTQINVNPTPTTAGDNVEIIAKQKAQGKMVAIAVDNTGRNNPFLPDGERVYTSTHHKTVAAISLPYLTPPPQTLPPDPDAGKIMNTTISGILYDKYSPSAIINIEGTDYLVKKGDVINRYKVLSIGKNQVIVKLGRNIYTAGVGEIFSLTDLQNVTANLNKKFGGNEVTINIKKKG